MAVSPPRNDLVRQQLKTLAALIDEVEAGQIVAIHKSRVASRRLRELVPLLPLRSKTAARLLRDLRRTTRGLGTVRELDVTGELIERLRNERTDARAGLTRVLTAVRRERATAYRKATKAGRFGRDLRRLVARLEKALARLDAPSRQARLRRPPVGDTTGVGARSWRWAIDARLTRRATRLADAMTAAGPFYVPERLHQVRIALKKLRYAVEVAGAAGATGDVRTRPDLRRLKSVQELLGEMHDRQMLIERLRETQARMRAADRRFSRTLDETIAHLENECRLLHARYLRQRPRLLATCETLAPAPNPAASASAGRVVARRASR